MSFRQISSLIFTSFLDKHDVHFRRKEVGNEIQFDVAKICERVDAILFLITAMEFPNKYEWNCLSYMKVYKQTEEMIHFLRKLR